MYKANYMHVRQIKWMKKQFLSLSFILKLEKLPINIDATYYFIPNTWGINIRLNIYVSQNFFR